jgi:hypothetical protein
MPDEPDEIELTAKLELAFKSVTAAHYQDTGEALAGLALYAAQDGGEIDDRDRLIFSVINPDDELAHAGIHTCEANVVLFTKCLDEKGEAGPARATLHQRRAAACRAIFGEDSNGDTLLAQLNAVAGLGVSDLVQEGNDERGKSDDGSCWVWRRKLAVTAHLEDS